jgi:hypothetical protein
VLKKYLVGSLVTPLKLFCCCLKLFVCILLQDRLKKLKSEHGKVQLGNITVDMVCILSLKNYVFFTGPYSEQCSYFPQVLGGMRGMTGMLWETSLLDPEEVFLLISLCGSMCAVIRAKLACIS